MFTKKDRSSFPYWFAHWSAFQMTALNLHAWKFKYLFHDFEKPWLKLIWGDYQRVKMWHKHHNSHHVLYGRSHGYNKVDWLAAVIDWECSHLTKCVAVRNGREEIDYLVSDKSKYTTDEIEETRRNCYPILDYLGL